jgi:hypothetical protein
MISVPDLLDEVADEVSLPDGWLQEDLGDYESLLGPVCAMGGIYRVMLRHGVPWYTHNDQNAYVLPVADYINEHPDEYGEYVSRIPGLRAYSIVGYNNAPGRTAGEVADLFRTVAKHLREET